MVQLVYLYDVALEYFPRRDFHVHLRTKFPMDLSQVGPIILIIFALLLLDFLGIPLAATYISGARNAS